ncbi:MAG: S1C family serine protease, partial [Acidimicrobiales bacterium]
VLGLAGGAAAGTGMVLTPSGEVLTNNHVVEGATSVKVTDIGNGRTYGATVVGTDKTSDVAVLQLSGASGLTTVTLGNSSKVTKGQAVTAIGNAGGAGGTPSVTTGQVTALDQSIVASDEIDQNQEHLNGLLQTDASLQPGDSGGPLVDNSAQVIAMNTAASSNYQFQSGPSASYAIPIDEAATLADQMEAHEGSSTVHVGAAAIMGVTVQGTAPTPGAPVKSVEPGSPAAGTGITPGDVITSVGGQSVDSASALSDLMEQHHPGDRVQVSWLDPSGHQHTATVTLVTGPAT